MKIQSRISGHQVRGVGSLVGSRDGLGVSHPRPRLKERMCWKRCGRWTTTRIELIRMSAILFGCLTLTILLQLSFPDPTTVYAQGDHSQQISDPIRDYLLSQQPEGSGPLTVLGRVHSDLDADDSDETVVLYEYQIGPSRDRTHTRYLIVFWHRDGRLLANEAKAIGFVGLRLPEKLNLDGRELLIRGLRWEGGDPLCCPSERYSERYFLRGRRLLRKQ